MMNKSRIKKDSAETAADRLARYFRIIAAFDYARLPTTQAGIGAQLRPPLGQAAVSAWKRVNPSLGHLAQITRLTGVSGHWLLTGDGAMVPIERPETIIADFIDHLPDSAKAEILGRIKRNRDLK